MKVYYDKWNEELVTEEEARKIALEVVTREESYLDAIAEMGNDEIWNMLSKEQQDKILNKEVKDYLEDEDNFISKDF